MDTVLLYRTWATGLVCQASDHPQHEAPGLATPGTVEPVPWKPVALPVLTEHTLPCSPQGPALTLLLVDEACWLRTLPQALTEAEANAEIYRKGWYHVALPPLPAAFRKVGSLGSAWAGP